MTVPTILARLALAGAALLAAGCMTQPVRRADHRPVLPTEPHAEGPVTGGLYHASIGTELFADVKARRVGDVITVILQERTQASKSASTSISKETEVELPSPTLFGREITLGNNPLFNNNIDSSSEFDGEGDSSQSNRLSGDIAVTVAAVYPNGNLLVRGEKVLTLNQGSEVIRISGLVRRVDVTPQNTVLSTQIADAQITYSGSGAVAESNVMGWLARFFISALLPF